MTKCLKCNKKEYCSKFCKEHFNSYFERKFKAHLRKNKLLKKNEVLSVHGENKELVKELLADLGRKVSVKFSNKGRRIESFALDTRAVKELANYMTKNKKLKLPISFLECFTQEEINKYASKIVKPKFTKFEQKLNKLMKESITRRPNIYYCTHNMMKELI
jgi:hypothetical protein